MATTKSSKTTKRKARDSDCAYAAELVRRYREQDPFQMKMPGGEIFVEQFVDGDYLASELERFARYRTWDASTEYLAGHRRNMKIIYRAQVARLRAKDVPALEAAGIVADHFGIGLQTVLDAVYVRKASKT